MGKARITLICAVGVVGLVGIVLITASTSIKRKDAGWQAYRQALVADGEPVTIAEVLSRRPRVPADRNGARVLEQLADRIGEIAGESVTGVPFLDSDIRPRDLLTGIPRSSAQSMRDFVAEHRSLIGELGTLQRYDIGLLSNDRYGHSLPNPFDWELPIVGFLRTASRLEELLALFHIIDSRLNEATESVLLQFTCASVLRYEPATIIGLARGSFARGGMRSLEAALSVGEVDLQILDDIAERIGQSLDAQTLGEILRWERAFSITLFDRLAEGTLTAEEVFGADDAQRLGRLTLYEIRFLQRLVIEGWTQLVEVADQPVELLARAEKIVNTTSPVAWFNVTVAEALGNVEPSRAAKLKSITFAAGPFLSLSRSMIRISLRDLAVRRCTGVAVAAEKFRMAKGRFPGTIHELAPDVGMPMMTDPFTGDPLKLVATDTGIVIYSVGRNKTDDNGDVVPKKDYGSAPDTGIRLRAPEQRKPIPVFGDRR